MGCLMKVSGLLALSLAVAGSVQAEDSPARRDYQLVLLSEVDDPDAVSRLAPQHRERIGKNQGFLLKQMFDADVAVLFGELRGEEDEPPRTAALVDLGTTAEARRVFGEMPAVATGLRRLEVLAVSGPADRLRAGPDPEDRISVWLGVLERHYGRRGLEPDELRRVEAEHAENLKRWEEEEDVAWVGRVEEHDEIRTVVVFRATDRRKAEALLSADPAVRADRLRYDLLRWSVPRGSWGGS